jgi:hypothetical protein
VGRAGLRSGGSRPTLWALRSGPVEGQEANNMVRLVFLRETETSGSAVSAARWRVGGEGVNQLWRYGFTGSLMR